MQAAGVVKGRPIALHVLDYGLFRVHANGRVIGICGYVIRTDCQEVILVDTGFPAKYASDAAAASEEDRLFEFGEVLQCDDDNLPAAQLSRLGLLPSDVTLHVLTHTHIDHVGGLGDFAHVPIVVAEAERALARPLYWGAIQPLAWPTAKYVTVVDDVQLGPGLRLFVVPGHAPGQLALLVDLPETGQVLLTSDAISRPEELDESFAGSWDATMAMASALRLLRVARAEGAFIIYGHSPEQWPELRKAPDGYF